jgi:hypothetical protein
VIQPPFQLTIRTDQLRQYRTEAVLLIRLGAVANAILSIGRAFRVTDKSLGQIRDQVHYTALLASFAVEAGRIINESSDRVTWQLADAGLATDKPFLARSEITALRLLLAEDSEFLKTCAFVRDQHTFHIDAKPVLRWLGALPPNDGIILQTVESARFADCLFDASANAVRASLPSAAQQPDYTDQLTRFAQTTPLLVHVMTQGFGLLIGTDLATRQPPTKPPYEINLRLLTGRSASTVAIEIRPVQSTWSPFYVGMPTDQAAKARPELRAGNRADRSPTRPVGRSPKRDYPGWWIRVSSESAAPNGDSHYIYCAERPTAIIFGQVGGEQHRALLHEDWGPRKVTGIPPTPTVVG